MPVPRGLAELGPGWVMRHNNRVSRRVVKWTLERLLGIILTDVWWKKRCWVARAEMTVFQCNRVGDWRVVSKQH
jgi:hypothetical protein